jgi:rhamnosyltransferase
MIGNVSEKAAPNAALVVGAIVTYHPDLKVLSKVLNATAVQTTYVLIVANDGAPWSCPLPANVTILKQDNNFGLGAAYNVAARWARERGATHLLLLDQDSVPAPGMVAKLITVFTRPSRTAAVGGLWRDSRTGQEGFFLQRSAWGTRRYRPSPGEIVSVDFLISSGSLIALDALADIGSFDEALFIEHVDTDWTLRARAKGYQLYGVADARLEHRFGEATWTIPLLGRRQLFLYSPERHYYRLRNSIALWRRPYVPWRWIPRNVLGTIALTVFYLICAPPRLERLRLLFRAVRDGLRMQR